MTDIVAVCQSCKGLVRWLAGECQEPGAFVAIWKRDGLTARAMARDEARSMRRGHDCDCPLNPENT